MGKFVECVPNFSEGRDLSKINAIVDAARSVPGVLVLDVDRRWYEPYWAADVQVFKAMAVKTKNFGHGGYAVIKAAR